MLFSSIKFLVLSTSIRLHSIARTLTCAAFVFGWVLFRATDFATANTMQGAMIGESLCRTGDFIYSNF